MPQNLNPLIVVTGQTATGKTGRAIDLAKTHDGELVNADSRQVYKYLDIVTGKDKGELQASGVPFHMIDVVDPKERYSSHEYVKAAAPIIEGIWRRGRTPVIVGGTYLYIKHLLYGFDIEVPPNTQLRAELEEKSLEELQQILSPRPSDINDSDWNNMRRLVRRIEIQRAGAPVLSKKSNAIFNKSERPTLIGLKHGSRESLESAIIDRVNKRIAQGAFDEVSSILNRGYEESDPGLETIGYAQIVQFIKGTLSKAAAVKEWTTREIQYAKRQLTFMKSDPHITWI